MVIFRIVAICDMILVLIQEGMPEAKVGLPLCGSHLAQAGILFVLATIVSETWRLWEEARARKRNAPEI